MSAPTTTPAATRTADHPGTAPGVATTEDNGCPACPHPPAEHDPIAARFCRATVAGSFDRGCVCRH